MEISKEHHDKFISLLDKICGDNQVAKEFLLLWCRLIDYTDDIVDGDIPKSKTAKILIYMGAMTDNAFYKQYSSVIFPLICLIVNNYEDSNTVFDKGSPQVIKKHTVGWINFCDYLRSSGYNMLYLVCLLVNGYDKLREISAEVRTLSYNAQHDDEGNPN